MRQTQQQIVLKHLREYGEISSNKAWAMYGITRLSDVVHKLRRKGFNIQTVGSVGKNRYGAATHFAVYKIMD